MMIIPSTLLSTQEVLTMNHRSSKSSLFLMELIMSILFFSLASAICLMMFIKSHTLSKESVELNHSVTLCESVVEQFYGNNGDLKDEIIFYTKDFKVTSSQANAQYALEYGTRSLSEDGCLIECSVSVTDIKDNNDIYSLNVTYFKK